MLRIAQLKLPVEHTQEELRETVYSRLKILNKINHVKLSKENLKYRIIKQSIDARKGEVRYIYTVEVDVSALLEEKGLSEAEIVRKCKNPDITISDARRYPDISIRTGNISTDEGMSASAKRKPAYRPVIVGSGPAGLFCAYTLALAGYCPIVIERGEKVEDRSSTVERFFQKGMLNPESNVQFGEGGAGTFSDGKFNTMVKDKTGRNTFVLETFVKFGADEKLLYMNKPHIGTDVLSVVVKNMREEIIRLGGTFLFDTKMVDFRTENYRLAAVVTVNTKDGNRQEIPCEVLVLATGHSARDTFEMLYQKQLFMEPKAFAMGVRIEHKRAMIDEAQYGNYKDILPAADYKLTHRAKNGRGVYTFCMCPGGYVINSSSEKGLTCVNGMSYSGRDGENSNSAIIVTVTKEDFSDRSPLGGVRLQRELEKAAYIAGEEKIPVQMFGDFKKNIVSSAWGDILPQTKGDYVPANLNRIFPSFISESLVEGIDTFAVRIKDYNRYDAVISGVESRTSSPLRILRNEAFESNISGIYPCGEGAGYAGGITSAAMDGIKVFEAIAKKYAPLTE